MSDATQFILDTPFVNLVAIGPYAAAKKMLAPSVIIYVAAPDASGVVSVLVDDVHLVGIGVFTAGAAPALRVGPAVTMVDSWVIGCAFGNDLSVPCVDADPLGSLGIGGYWEQCWGKVGFMGGCDVLPGTLLVDCWSNDNSFGEIFEGEAIECRAGGDSFGATANVGVMRRCENLSRFNPLPAGPGSKFYDCTIAARSPIVSYLVTGFIDGTSPPTPIGHDLETFIVTVTQAPYTIDELWTSDGANWNKETVSLGETMRPDAVYGSYDKDRVYSSVAGPTWELRYSGSSVLVLPAAIPVFHRCTLVAEDVLSPSIVAAAPEVIKAGHCMMNTDTEATTITNEYDTGYNIVDVDVEV
jgi:hypothetical protein